MIYVERGRPDCWQGCIQNIILYWGPHLTTEQFQDDWCRVDGYKSLKKSKRIGVTQRQTGKKVEIVFDVFIITKFELLFGGKIQRFRL